MRNHDLKLEFKSFHSPDIEELFTWHPKSGEEVCFWLEFEIGEHDTNESFMFGVTIANQQGYNKNKKEYPNALFEPVIIVADDDWSSIKNALKSILDECSANTWELTLVNLKKHFAFEHG
ncbi:hypothetical protein TUM4644_18860 [Shewanella colwelliana]|uniref:Uncharacterized protein n=1 Tax=Shewanella colwelliana TaxID=23 RepID=A0ABQ4NVR7_SHECO|nr:Imm8 family immunity protein [Shewanella colwelliana]GIU24426.1 hypothetical protein TUM4644_18860 [Shewanella colwelliana]GIU36974.1 hypothetical protein TUM3794_06930 [Shewanella colwelliana]